MVHLLCKLIGYHTTLLLIMYGCVSAKTVCLHERFVMRWDLRQYSYINYAYIQHEGELMVTIGSPNTIIIEDRYNKIVHLQVTETWLIKMTYYNITFRENGTYTCTVGFKNWRKDVKINKAITIKDLNEIIFLKSTVDNGCSVVNCFSKYNVTLLGPEGKETKNNTCLSEKDNGIFSCCFLDHTVCQNADCKYINVSTEYHTYANAVGETESTSPSVTMNGEKDYDYTKVTIVIIVLVVVIPVVFFLGAIILNIKNICKKSKKGAEKPTEENRHMFSEGTE